MQLHWACGFGFVFGVIVGSAAVLSCLTNLVKRRDGPAFWFGYQTSMRNLHIVCSAYLFWTLLSRLGNCRDAMIFLYFCSRSSPKTRPASRACLRPRLAFSTLSCLSNTRTTAGVYAGILGTLTLHLLFQRECKSSACYTSALAWHVDQVIMFFHINPNLVA